MPWCPNCKTEYRPGFDTCSDCGAGLVEEMPVGPPVPLEREDTSWRRPVLITTLVAFGYLVIWFLWALSRLTTAPPLPGEFTVLLTLMCVFGFFAGLAGIRRALFGMAIGWCTCIGLFATVVLTSDGLNTEALEMTLFVLLFSLLFSAPAAVSAHLGSRYSHRNGGYLPVWIALTVVLAALPYLAAYSAK